MAEKLVFDFHIQLYKDQVSTMKTVNGAVAILPFTGFVKSELFTGTILPGAADIQITNTAGVKHMHACYMFEGTDYTGKACKVFIDNNGYFMRDVSPSLFETTPTIMTDSEALQDYLHSARFRATGGGEPDGYLHIKVYDICPGKDEQK